MPNRKSQGQCRGDGDRARILRAPNYSSFDEGMTSSLRHLCSDQISSRRDHIKDFNVSYNRPKTFWNTQAFCGVVSYYLYGIYGEDTTVAKSW